MRLNWYRVIALFFALLSAAFVLAVISTLVHADDFADRFAGKIPCPTPEPCKIVVLSQGEEKLLMQPNGILDTAAQARALDLGQFAVYLKTRIANSPAGENAKPAAPTPPAVDSGVPADVKPN